MGEQWWWLTLALYLPFWVWGAPLLVLIPMAWRWRRRQLFWLAGGAFWLLIMIGGWRWNHHAIPEGEGQTFTIMTYNAGENRGTRLDPFFTREKPDLLTLQDAHWERKWLGQLKEEGGYHIAVLGSHALVSRWPIGKAELLPRQPLGGHPVGARFEVTLPGGPPLTVYSLHLPTPRRALQRLMKPERKGRIAEFRAYQQRRIALYRETVARLAAEPGPMVAAGDLNITAHGYLHTLFSKTLNDAFAQSGRGFGYTFPGWDPEYPRFKTPWARLDSILSSPELQPLDCRVEPDRLTQHRAVVATFARPSLPAPSR